MIVHFSSTQSKERDDEESGGKILGFEVEDPIVSLAEISSWLGMNIVPPFLRWWELC